MKGVIGIIKFAASALIVLLYAEVALLMLIYNDGNEIPTDCNQVPCADRGQKKESNPHFKKQTKETLFLIIFLYMQTVCRKENLLMLLYALVL